MDWYDPKFRINCSGIGINMQNGPHLTLPYGEDVLPPSAEASNGPNAHPRINQGYKIPKCNTHMGPYQHVEPSPSLEGTYSLEAIY